MTRMTLAPCSPFLCFNRFNERIGRSGTLLSRGRLHTHLAENQSDVAYSLENFGLTPGDYAESLGWTGPDVWHAHCVQLDDSSIENFSRTRTGIAHCPTSNMRLGSGIAPLRKMLKTGVAGGLGVDGSASNDSCNLLHEARAACLLARVADRDPAAITARQALELATLGGAAVLGRDDIGRLAPGMCADFIAVDVDRPQFAGVWDIVAALILCQTDSVDYSFINGKKIVDRGLLTAFDLPEIVARTNSIARKLIP